MSFLDLAAAAQVGTRKAAPPRGTELSLKGAERTLLLELGTLGLMRRAGATGTSARPFPPSPPETLRVADAAEVLEEAHDLKATDLLLQWAAQAVEKGFVAPPAALPILIPLAQKGRELRAVLGERGHWLARLMGVELEESEAESPLAEAPGAEAWDALDAGGRAALVARLPEDAAETFQKALADRRQEVRNAAAMRLVRLPGSPQAETLRRMASAAVAVQRSLLRRSLHVVPPDPETLPKWLPRGVVQSGMGPAALALRDLVAHVPPSLWAEPPESLLALALKSDYPRVLLEGWYDGALLFDDAGWIDALLRHYATHETFIPPALSRRASDQAFEAAVLDRLQGGHSAESKLRPFVDRRRPLLPRLSRTLVEAVRDGGAAFYWMHDYGHVLSPSVLPLLDAPWGEDSPPERLRQRWRTILDLQRRLMETLR